jgi:hypothetical protein
LGRRRAKALGDELFLHGWLLNGLTALLFIREEYLYSEEIAFMTKRRCIP